MVLEKKEICRFSLLVELKKISPRHIFAKKYVFIQGLNLGTENIIFIILHYYEMGLELGPLQLEHFTANWSCNHLVRVQALSLLDYEHYMYGLTLIMYLYYHLFHLEVWPLLRHTCLTQIPLVIHDHINVKDPSWQKYLANSLTVTSWLTMIQKQ